MNRLFIPALLVLAMGSAYAQNTSPNWKCATQAIADAAKTAKDPNGFSPAEQAALDEATKRCTEPQKTPQEILEFHIDQYMKCARVATLSLDDGISDAATVATGAQSMCHDYLRVLANLKVLDRDASGWGDILRPGVVSSILAHRVATKSAPVKPPTARPNTKQM